MTDPETANALWGLGLAVLIVAAVVLRIAFRQTRPMATRWPHGHGESYFNRARTINDE